MTEFNIRPITASDDAAMAAVIRTVMPEFGAVGDGFAINDPEVDWLSRAYSEPHCAYFVIERDGVVLRRRRRCAADRRRSRICELRKMYFLPEARGAGAGARDDDRLPGCGAPLGFKRCYLETLSGMDAAMRLYERSGFRRIAGPMGATGHGGCNAFYLLDL